MKLLKKSLHEDGKSSMDLGEYFNTFKKGSRKNRKIICSTKHGFNFKKLDQVKTFVHISESPIPTNERSKNIHLAWTKTFLPNRMRTFLFKFYNNLLGTGNRVAHFVGDYDSGCTFCSVGLVLPAPIETCLHIFWHCQFVNPIIL